MKKNIFLITMAAIISLIFCCSSNSNEPLIVAKGFWNALEDRDLDKAKTYATEESAGSLQINEDEEDQEVEIAFGEVTYENGKSFVETTMRTTKENTEHEFPLKTVLVKEKGKWKVDVNETMMSIFGGAMGAMMESMKEGMEEMGEAMADEMKAGMEKMEKEFSNNDDD